ncbi:MAG: hypothetical protein QOI65_517, partial [Thermoleophilaceae bacterium]|nr:hypothetical protein [Thermoleophilaceae bacterium]
FPETAGPNACFGAGFDSVGVALGASAVATAMRPGVAPGAASTVPAAAVRPVALGPPVDRHGGLRRVHGRGLRPGLSSRRENVIDLSERRAGGGPRLRARVGAWPAPAAPARVAAVAARVAARPTGSVPVARGGRCRSAGAPEARACAGDRVADRRGAPGLGDHGGTARGRVDAARGRGHRNGVRSHPDHLGRGAGGDRLRPPVVAEGVRNDRQEHRRDGREEHRERQPAQEDPVGGRSHGTSLSAPRAKPLALNRATGHLAPWHSLEVRGAAQSPHAAQAPCRTTSCSATWKFTLRESRSMLCSRARSSKGVTRPQRSQTR